MTAAGRPKIGPPAGQGIVRTTVQPEKTDSAAAALLRLEAGLRQLRSFREIAYYAANETRTPLRAQQVFFVVAEGRPPAKLRIDAISSLTTVDRTAPLVQALEQRLAAMRDNAGLTAPREFDSAAASGARDALSEYPLSHMLWLPCLGLENELLGGLVLARAQPWTESEITIARHVASAISFAWLAVAPTHRGRRWPALPSRRTLALTTAVVAALLCIPVSMSALAPVEVAPRDALVVTAGVDGVVEVVEPSPNANVAPGDVLVRLADVVLRNRAEIAERDVLVAEASVRKASQLAFVDLRGRHDLALAQADLELKMAERDYARDMLERATVKAERGGVVVFGDKKDLVGKPVAVGEKLMEIVDPKALEFRIDLPAADAIVLKAGARVTVFLDSDPLSPIDARLVRADYRARVRETQALAFRLVAEVPPGREQTLRLGVRGTAQVYSEKVPLGFYLLRRPIASLRQMFGV